jgi:hypothetical protein
MPNTTTSEIRIDESAGDLRIDTFDQMHNPADLRLWPSNWAAPVEPDVS